MKDNMFFPGQGMGPMNQMGPMGQMGGMPGFPGQMMPNINQLENRIASMERQIKRIDARLSRLETPYPAPTPFPSTGQMPYQPTEQPGGSYTSPYQTSMQVM